MYGSHVFATLTTVQKAAMFRHHFPLLRRSLRLNAIALLSFTLMSHPAWAAYGLAMGAEAKYADGQKPFAYVNPQAPKGGTLVLGTLGSFNTLNPYLLKGDKPPGLTPFGDNLMFETLMVESWDEPFAMYGLLAKDIQLASDKKSVTFTLNPAAKFVNGEPVLAEDVVYSFNTLVKSEAVSPFYRFYYADVDKVEALDAHRVRFVFKKPNAELHLILGQFQVFWRKSFPNGIEQAANLLPIGSGPYVLKRYDFNGVVEYQRRADHWAKALPIRQGFWNFDVVRFKFYRDPTTFTEALKAGKIDLTAENSSKNWARAYKNPSLLKRGLQLKEFNHGNNAGLQGFVLNTRRAPLDDVAFRQALSLSFDFETVSQQMQYGLFKRSYSYFSNSELAAQGLPTEEELAVLEPLRAQLPAQVFNQEVPMPAKVSPQLGVRPNLLLARSVLLQAGYRYENGRLLDKKGHPISLEYLTNSKTFERISGKWQRDLAKLGIELRIRLVDGAVYQKRLMAYDYDIITHVYGQSQSPGNEQTEMHSCASANTPPSSHSGNMAGSCEPAIDALLKRFEHFESREELVAVSKSLDRVLRHQYYVIPQWYSDKWRMVYWDKFEYAPNLPLYYGPTNWALMTWWHKS